MNSAAERRTKFLLKEKATEDLIRLLECKYPKDLLDLIKRELQNRPDFLRIG